MIPVFHMNTETQSSICVLSLTRAGAQLANKIRSRLSEPVDVFTLARYALPGQQPFENTAECFRHVFLNYDTIIAVMASGIVVRMIAPLLNHKAADPAVIVCDVAGKHAISLLSGHLGGANAMTVRLAQAIGADPVITTASDSLGLSAVDTIAQRLGCTLENFDTAKELTRRIIDGERIAVIGAPSNTELPKKVVNLPINPELFNEDAAYSNTKAVREQLMQNYDGLILITFNRRIVDTGIPTSILVKKDITAGIGCKKNTPEDVLRSQIEKALSIANIHPLSVRTLATIALKKHEPAICSAAAYYHAELTIVPDEAVRHCAHRFDGSDFVLKTTGLPAVSEPCGFIASNSGDCVLSVIKEQGTTISLWKNNPQRNIMKEIFVVGLGPGLPEYMTEAARTALADSDVITGYKTYMNLIKELPEVQNKELLVSGMRSETDRCNEALDLAENGKSVSIVSSGDPGLYGMAGLMLELAEARKKDKGTEYNIQVIPGITAAGAAAASLGAPMMHDTCLISLSDLLTPWEKIEKRLHMAGEGDFVVCLYNPKSHERPHNLEKAQRILLQYKAPTTPVGIVRNAKRNDERIIITTLDMLSEHPVDMLTTVVIGNSQTVISSDGSKIITPRGYTV